MPTLFDPIAIGALTLPNRVLRSATWEGLADEAGHATERLTAALCELGHGDVGLIVAGYAYVDPAGQSSAWQLGLHTDEHQAALADTVRAVHDTGGLLAVQLVHGGLQSDPELTGQTLFGPSSPLPPMGVPARGLSPQQLRAVIMAFVSAARRAADAGVDAIQLHVAHGYLLSEFLSPDINRRTDSYGGSIADRVRIVTEIVAGIRESVGPAVPLLVKMNGRDCVPGGLEAEDAAGAAALLEAAGIDAIEVSGGTRAAGKQGAVRAGVCPGENEAYFRDQAVAIRERTSVPLFLVGGIRSIETAEDLINAGTADGIALCRPLIREPGLVRRWQHGDRAPARCASCNRCFVPIRRGKGPACLREHA